MCSGALRVEAAKHLRRVALIVCGAYSLAGLQGAQVPVSRSRLGKARVEVPFSFVYDGKPSRDFISTWKRSETTKRLADGRTLGTVTYSDPQTRLEVIAEKTLFPDRNATEWLVRMRNGGKQDTPIIQQIRPMDLQIDAAPSERMTFHYVLGSALRPVEAPASSENSGAFPCPDCAGAGQGEGLAGDFAGLDKAFPPSGDVQLSHYVFSRGQHRESYLPFFNLQWLGGGLIGAIGWTGQWTVHGTRSPDSVVLQAGQATTHFKLHPGEAIRTPRVLIIEWHGADWLDGQNELRRLLVAPIYRRVNGEVPLPPVAHTGAYALIFDDIAKKTGRNPLEVLPNTSAGGSRR